MTLLTWFLIYFWNHAFMHLHLSFMLSCCFTCFCLVIFLVLLYFVLHIKQINFFFKKKKSEKYKNSVCFVYIGTRVPWMAIETKFSKLCIFCRLDEHLYAQLSKWVLWLLFVMSKMKLSLVLNTLWLFLTGRTKKSWEKGINNHLTIAARQSCMTSVCFGIVKVWCQWHLCA